MRQSPLASKLLSSSSVMIKLAILALLLSQPAFTAETEEDHDHEEESSSSDKFSTDESWLYGMLTGVMLGVLGFICSALVVVIKKYSKISFDPFLKVLIAFAAGALIGDAVIHLLPHAFAPHSHSEEEHATEEAGHTDEHSEEESEVSAELLSFFVCLGIVLFALIERIFHMLGIGHSHGVEGHSHGHSHNHHEHKNEHKQCKVNKNQVVQSQNIMLPNIANPTLNDDNIGIIENIDSNALQNKDSQEQQQDQDKRKSTENEAKMLKQDSNEDISPTQIDLTIGWKNKKPEGYLNLIGDFLHNIMDGIALGVSFTSTTKSKAASTVVAIVAHEIPQEMGDVSILLNSNFSGLQAIICNGIINFSALIGIIIGISVASLSENAERIMNCFIAGNFLFIGAAEMLPKLSEEKSNRMAFLQLFGLCVGFGVMFLITLAEEEE